MNQATHFLDGSMIYGSTDAKAVTLRAMKSGKLTTVKKNDNELLPMSDTPEDSCQFEKDGACFKSGRYFNKRNTNVHENT